MYPVAWGNKAKTCMCLIGLEDIYEDYKYQYNIYNII